MSSDSPQIQEIKKRYKASFPEKIALLARLKNEIAVDEELDTAREELHKLAGSSGMYGYSDVADNCRVAMKQIDDGQVGELLQSIDTVIRLIEQES